MSPEVTHPAQATRQVEAGCSKTVQAVRLELGEAAHGRSSASQCMLLLGNMHIVKSTPLTAATAVRRC
jgi:hypothetical protein